jgi:hypothetical protein
MIAIASLGLAIGQSTNPQRMGSFARNQAALFSPIQCHLEFFALMIIVSHKTSGNLFKACIFLATHFALRTSVPALLYLNELTNPTT